MSEKVMPPIIKSPEGLENPEVESPSESTAHDYPSIRKMFADNDNKLEKLAGALQELADGEGELDEGYRTNKQIAGTLFSHYGGEDVYSEKKRQISAKKAELQKEIETAQALRDLYKSLGGTEVDELEKRLAAELKQAGDMLGDPRSGETSTTLKELEEARDKFVKGYQKHHQETQKDNLPDELEVSDPKEEDLVSLAWDTIRRLRELLSDPLTPEEHKVAIKEQIQIIYDMFSNQNTAPTENELTLQRLQDELQGMRDQRAALLDEYNKVSKDDENSPETDDLRKNIEDLDSQITSMIARMAEVEARMAKTSDDEAKKIKGSEGSVGDGGDVDSRDDESPERKALREKLLDRVQRTREAFAKAKYDTETHFFKRVLGGRKRHARLLAAKQELAEAEMALAKFDSEKVKDAVQAAVDAGADKEEAFEQAVAAQAYGAVKAVEELTQQKIDEKYGNEQLGWFEKTVGKIGKWFTGGSGLAKWLKGAGTGFVAGATTTLVATWPITTVVGLAAGVGVAAATKLGYLQDQVGQNRDIGRQQLGLSVLADIQEVSSHSKEVGGADVLGELAGRAIEEVLEGSIKSSLERQRKMRETVRAAMGRFGIGFAAGGLAGRFADLLSSGSQEAANGSVNQPSGGETTSGAHPSDGGTPHASQTPASSGGEVAPGTSHMTTPAGGEPGGLTGSSGQLDGLTADIYTNGAPEHTLEELTGVDPARSSDLLQKLVDALGLDGVFETADGKQILLTKYGGNIGIGFSGNGVWYPDASLTPPAREFLATMRNEI